MNLNKKRIVKIDKFDMMYLFKKYKKNVSQAK